MKEVMYLYRVKFTTSSLSLLYAYPTLVDEARVYADAGILDKSLAIVMFEESCLCPVM